MVKDPRAGEPHTASMILEDFENIVTMIIYCLEYILKSLQSLRFLDFIVNDIFQNQL